jgi:type II secretory pathway pseudopilin PulG
MNYKITILIMLIIGTTVLPSYAEEKAQKDQKDQKEQKAQGLDMVSDTVAAVFGKANALLAGDLEVTMDKDKTNTEEQFTRNALGQKVPKSTAVGSAGSLHNDQPL